MTLSPKRRHLLRALVAAPLSVTMGAHAQLAAPRRLLVLVFLHGGNDGFNTWVPYADPLYYKVRPTIAVPRDAVLKISDGHGFNPALAPLMGAWEARELAIVQGIGYPLVTQQHYRDSEIAFTAEDSELLGEGWVSRALARSSAAGTGIDALAFDLLDIRQADPMGPFRGDRIAAVQVPYAYELLAKRRVADCVVTANTRGRAALARGGPGLSRVALATSFPDDPFGQAARATVELAASDPGVAVIQLALNGLDGDKHHSVDTHWNQNKYHGDALARLARGLAALRAGLREIGRWDETIVATYDEFGRSPIENDDHGTHHGAATTHFVMGGRVAGGLHGAAPKVEKIWWIGGPAPVVDTRQLWAEIAASCWGASSSDVFGRAWHRIGVLRT